MMINQKMVETCLRFLLFFYALNAISNESDNQKFNENNSSDAKQYKTVEWIDLLPADDLKALLNPPEYLTEIEENSLEDTIDSRLKNKTRGNKDDRYQEALQSEKVVEDMDGRRIRIPGFIVPLEFDDEELVIQFFFVPFFGACLHLPPPPPNQIILVDFPTGIPIETLYTPFWISGKLNAKLVEKNIATAAYSMRMDVYEVYRDE